MAELLTNEQLAARVEKLERRLVEQSAARQKLEENLNQLKQLYDTAPFGYQSLDADGIITDVNRSWLGILGYTRDEVVGKPFSDFLTPADKDHFKACFDTFKSTGSVSGVELELLCKDGTPVRVSHYGKIVQERAGSQAQTHCILHDVSEHRLAEMALHDSETRYRALFESMSEGFVLYEILIDDHDRPFDFRFLDINPAGERLIGMNRSAAIGRSGSEIGAESVWIERFGRIALTGESAHFQEYSPELKRWFEVFAYRPGPGQCAAVFTDITKRMWFETALKESEAQLRSVIRAIPDLVWLKDPHGIYLSCNPKFEKLYGAREKDIIGKTDYDFVDKELADFFRKHDRAAVTKGRPSINEEAVTYAEDGHRELLETIKTPIYTNDGQLTGVLGIGRDITTRKRAEAELRESEQKLRLFIEHAPAALAMFDRKMRYLAVSRRWIADFDLAGQEIIGRSHYDLFPEIPDRWKAVHARAMAGEVMRSDEDVFERLDGQVQWLQWEVRPWFRADGTVGGIVIFSADMTERKRLEAERVKLQAQLVQAQKMESVGRLAGGVAHDYNNMLSVIIGYAELVLEQVEPNDRIYEDVTEILKAGKRSMDITSQLLAFARQQTIAPRVVDLNEFVEHGLKMLRRLIGEAIDLTWSPRIGIWPVHIDPGQIDQILANLCVNARDAIADTGTITIETDHGTIDEAYCDNQADCVPGDYVMLTFSDNGHGMSPETLDKIFEPFFTTKVIGTGTGLGLATVYGIVKQNHGFINVYSEPGEGTTFKIHLPRHPGASTVDAEEVVEAIPRGRGETVLVVEDEAAILKVARQTLVGLDYRILLAGTPSEALALAHDHDGEIALLVTDVIMPGMNGKELADRLQTDFPGMKILFMSGYTADLIAHHGVLDEGVNYLQKPFSKRDLAVKVREALEGR